MARRHAHHSKIVTAFVRRLGQLEDGKVRCAGCSAVVGLTKNGKIRAHKSPAGEDCAYTTSYATRPSLSVLPPVVVPPERPSRDRRALVERDPSRLDVGSECQDCGRWLPGERIVCGKCSRKRAEARGRKD